MSEKKNILIIDKNDEIVSVINKTGVNIFELSSENEDILNTIESNNIDYVVMPASEIKNNDSNIIQKIKSKYSDINNKKKIKKEEKFKNISIKDCYNLTQQEKRVLLLLSTGNNNLQIARNLEISINTTKVHVCSILQKMGVNDRTQAAIKAIRENLIV